MVGRVSFSYGNGATSAESREEASRETHDAAGGTPALPISVGGRGALAFLFRASLPRLLQDGEEEDFFLALRAAATWMALSSVSAMSWAVVLPGVIWGWGMSLVSG